MFRANSLPIETVLSDELERSRKAIGFARDRTRNLMVNNHTLCRLSDETVLPRFRVVNVSDNGFRITVRHLLSWNTKEVTRDQAKPITFPTDTRAREEWLQHLSTEMSTTEDRSANLKRFMSELQRPQVKLLRPTSPDLGEEAGV